MAIDLGSSSASFDLVCLGIGTCSGNLVRVGGREKRDGDGVLHDGVECSLGVGGLRRVRRRSLEMRGLSLSETWMSEEGRFVPTDLKVS